MHRDLNLPRLREAALDFRYLLNRGYPRVTSLSLVGNRHNLPAAERQLLHRAVFATSAAAGRRAKLCALARKTADPLGIDGHNVLITLECYLRNWPLILADDGFLRDIGQISRNYRPSPHTATALNLAAQYLATYRPARISVYYDAPLSRSGELAGLTRDIFATHGLVVESRAVAVPERYLANFSGPVSTSDTALIDRIPGVVDLAGEIILSRKAPRVIFLW